MTSRSAPITYDDVKRACMRIIARGDHATLQAIYAELGHRGGNSTIHKFRKQFLHEIQQRGVSVFPSSVPPDLIPIIEDFWQQSVLLASSLFDKDKQRQQESLVEAQEYTRQATAETLQWKQYAKEKESDLADALAKIRRLQDRLDNLRTQNEDQQQELNRLRGARSDLQAEYQEKIRQIDADRQAERAEFEHQLRQKEQALTQAVERAELEIKRSDDQIDHWIRQLDSTRVSARESVEKSEIMLKRYQDELSVARTKEASLSTRLDRAEAENVRLKEELEHLKNHTATP